MMIATGTALCLLPACGLTVIQQPPAGKSAKPAYTGPLSFPAGINSFARGHYEKTDGPVPTGFAKYEMKVQKEGSAFLYTYSLQSTVRLMSAEGRTPEAALEEQENRLLRQYPKAVQETDMGRQKSGRYFTLDLPGPMHKRLGVELHAVRHGDQMVTYRFDYSAEKHDEFRDDINSFMKLFERR